MATTYQHIASNKRKTWGLVLLFPLAFALLVAVIIGSFLFYAGATNADMVNCSMNGQPCSPVVRGLLLSGVFSILIAAGIWVMASLWMLISFFFGDKWLLKLVDAQPITEQNFREVYRLVENLCISRGLPVPRIYLIKDDSLNAFATGRDPKHATIVLTTGIVAVLDRVELEGVIAHELSHIENYDIRLMLLCVTGISFFTLFGEFLLRTAIRSSGRRNKDSGGVLPVFLLALVFLLFGYVFAPLIRLAISRQREYQADATAALMTRNPAALSSALKKIAQDSRVEVLDSYASMSAMCIETPLDKQKPRNAWFANLTATHPPIEKRIAALDEMARGY